jgi:hypothetical protein
MPPALVLAQREGWWMGFKLAGIKAGRDGIGPGMLGTLSRRPGFTRISRGQHEEWVIELQVRRKSVQSSIYICVRRRDIRPVEMRHSRPPWS